MNENVIEFVKNADMATVTFCQTRFISKIRKLAEMYPGECEIIAENKDGSILARLPVKWIRISKITKAAKEYTEEEKREFVERLQQARKDKAKTDVAEDNDK